MGGAMVEDLALEASQLGHTLLSFLESVGAPQETQMYLRLFREVPRGRLAIVLPTDSVLRERAGTLAEQLALLVRLGVFVSIAVGAYDAPTTQEVRWLFDACLEAEVKAVKVVPGPHARAEAEQAFARGELPVIVLRERGDQEADPIDLPIAPFLEEFVSVMGPRKVIFLRASGGLGPHGAGHVEVAPGHLLLSQSTGFSVINLRSDQAPLMRGSFLSERDVAWLLRARGLLELLWSDSAAPVTVSVASPLSLLRELFTVRGEGTLIRLGADLRSASSWNEVKQPSVKELLEQSFGRPLMDGFFSRPMLEVHYEKAYRGLALLEPGSTVPYLSKFAVLPEARGEGLGQELWWQISRHHSSLYWRSRRDNPANTFYRAVCEGMHRTPEWTVFWRGVERSTIPTLIAEALARPADFSSNGSSSA
jgi:bifunctional N-acetylglutamate synthase/kinase